MDANQNLVKNPPPEVAFPYGEGGPAGGRKRGGTGSEFVPPHTRQGFALPPSPRRGFFPSSVPGCARSTLSVGEGDLRRGLLDFGSAKV